MLRAKMPNGKALGNCTREELESFARGLGKLGETMGKRTFGELTHKEMTTHYAGYTGYSLVESMAACMVAGMQFEGIERILAEARNLEVPRTPTREGDKRRGTS
jgi:hypothetical protein